MFRGRRRCTMKLFKGTTNLAFKYKHGIAVAAESRVTTLEFNGIDVTTLKAILLDEETKVLPMDPEKNIVCTLAGDCVYWHDMYDEVRTQAPISAEEAARKAYLHMSRISHDDLEAYRKRHCEELRFGTIIAGCKQECLQLHCLRLDEENNVAKTEVNVGALGSGALYAMWVLLDGHDLDSYSDTKDLTDNEAIKLAMKAVFYATVFDPYSGGYIRVYIVDETNGSREVAFQDPLDVYYENYNLYGMDEVTIFLLYSTKFKPYFREDELEGLMGDLWPTITKDDIIANHLVAKKRDFYFHRIVMASKELATDACDLINKALAPRRDPVALGGEFLACQLKLEDETNQGGDEYITIYVEKSSKELLQIIRNLQPADDLDYS